MRGLLKEGSEIASSSFFLLSVVASFYGGLREVGGWVGSGMMSWGGLVEGADGAEEIFVATFTSFVFFLFANAIFRCH